MKKVLVTSGGTFEYIDEVRGITNISTGKLGAIIASDLANTGGIEVYYLHSKTAVIPTNISIMKDIEVRTAQDTLEKMKEIITSEKIDVVIHAMAVSDFTFKRDGNVKLKSNDPEAFIEYLGKTITLNPKIISHIKEWDPKVFLIGFKFEVGYDPSKLREAAQDSIRKNKCNLVIANDKKEMENVGAHVAHFFYSAYTSLKYSCRDTMATSKEEISERICFLVSDVLTY